MKTFRLWLVEMANLFPQRKEGETNARVATTHMMYPVWSPTIFHVIITRDQEKYPDGMTPGEVAKELLEQSEIRTQLRPGEVLAPDNWKEELKRDSWPEFVRGISSMLNKSVRDFVRVGTRMKLKGARGKSPSIYHPTKEAVQREGGSKFKTGADRDAASAEMKAAKARREEERAAKGLTQQSLEVPEDQSTPIELADAPATPTTPQPSAGGDEIKDMLKDLFK